MKLPFRILARTILAGAPFLFLVTAIANAHETNVQLTPGSWADFAHDRAEVTGGIDRMIQDQYNNFIFPVDISALTPEQRAPFNNARCLRTNGSGQSEYLISAYCLSLLPPPQRDLVYDFYVRAFDRVMPSFGASLMTPQAVEVTTYDFLKIHQRSGPFPAGTPAEKLLSPVVPKLLWKVPSNGANCYGSALAAVANDGSPQYQSEMNSFLPYFRPIQDGSDWQIGDLILFAIPGDGHAMVYLGTDPQTRERVVLTKNGYRASPWQIMKYADVFKIYEPAYITGVSHFRQTQSFVITPRVIARKNPAKGHPFDPKFRVGVTADRWMAERMQAEARAAAPIVFTPSH